ncbi:MAG: Gfo/Idh/MocA family oxidoreductase [Gemmataceae bacterium]|nr:Gfo/Idh/MocA family oxidoreductase [Gemmataceae bacterium]
MRCVIVGLGTQGKKRRTVCGADAVATVDPVADGAKYRTLRDVPLHTYDAALVCTPDHDKVDLLRYLLGHGKHVLVEKPLLASAEALHDLARTARGMKAICYTAYNHRFEPVVAALKSTITSGRVGRVYLARMFYGNGTARDVFQSPWRDRGLGVLGDLGSHLLDLTAFLLGRPRGAFTPWLGSRFENKALDHVTFGAAGMPSLELSASLVSWRNSFEIDVVGETGSAHVRGLCKWGPSTLTVRRRVFPSGRPEEDTQIFESPDLTWAREYAYFQTLCRDGALPDFANDIWINQVLGDLAHRAEQREAA